MQASASRITGVACTAATRTVSKVVNRTTVPANSADRARVSRGAKLAPYQGLRTRERSAAYVAKVRKPEATHRSVRRSFGHLPGAETAVLTAEICEAVAMN